MSDSGGIMHYHSLIPLSHLTGHSAAELRIKINKRIYTLYIQTVIGYLAAVTVPHL